MSLENNQITVKHLKETISITKIGVFIWNLETNHVIYSKEWAEIVGYEQDELVPHVSTWESMLLPSDLEIAEANINKYLAGEAPIYEAEFRMVKKDGSVIWGHDKGKVTEYTEDGRPLILCGVLQDITNIKLTEQMLRESTDILNLAIQVAEFGTWDWDLEKDIISYNDEYLSMLGYTQSEINGSLAEWESMNHPEDLTVVTRLLDEFVAGTRDSYECEIRMRHKDGHYIWTKDVGQIVSKDKNGIATRVIGGHLNIDSLKNSQSKLEDTLGELENHQAQLEMEIEARTKSLTEQDTLLLAVNDISQKLLAVTETDDFDTVLLDCLKTLTLAYNTSEFTLWRYICVENNEFFYLTHLYRKDSDDRIAFDVHDMEEYIRDLILGGDNFAIHTREDFNVIINYSLVSPELRTAFENEKAISDFISGMGSEWEEDVKNQIENSDSSIVSSIFLYTELFGIIATGNNSINMKYSEAHENMLDISGRLFANAQNKHEMDEQLRAAHEEALLSTQAKTNFLANMSHEIRTPLNAILGMSEIVLRESKGRNIEEYAKEIKKASENLLVIVNDILDISKIESGKLEIIKVDYNITSLLNDIVSLAKMRLENKPVIFTTFIKSDIPSNLYGDEIRIRQILLNLLSNAIKFTKKGNINLSVNYEEHEDIAELVFAVSDTGMGIKDEDLQRLFMQFERVDTTKNRNIEGTGLGLSIAKQLCEMMNGSIMVESKRGLGSTFTVRIPQQYKGSTPIARKADKVRVLLYEARELYADSISKTISDLNAKCVVCTNQSELLQYLTQDTFDYLIAPVVHADRIKNLCLKSKIHINMIFTVDQGDFTVYQDNNIVNLPISCIQLAQFFGNSDSYMRQTKKAHSFIAPTAKVLIVDDNPVNLKVAKGLVSPIKLNIHTAVNGAEAVEMVKESEYDLVFMDHMMPIMDGIDATAAIRKLDGDYYKNLPIIALTANALVGARELFVKEGMNDFIAKPIEVKKLNEILKKWIPKEKQEIVAPTVKDEKTYDLSIAGIDTNYGINIIGGNLEDYYDVLNTYLLDGLLKLKKLKEPIREQNLNMFRIEMHALKSASGSIGASAVSKKAMKLEDAAKNQDIHYINSHTKPFVEIFESLLFTIEEHLKNNDSNLLEEKQDGCPELLNESLKEIEEALSSFDIDVLEQSILKCLSYTWEGKIDEMLMNLKQLIDSFEYYQARLIVEDLNKEILVCYGS